MEYVQKFIPEGWKEGTKAFSLEMRCKISCISPLNTSCFVRIILSAKASCIFASSFCKCKGALRQSMQVRIPLIVKWCCNTASVKMLKRIGAGLASPVVSMMICSVSLPRIARSCATKSSRLLQHAQPPCKRIVFSFV